MKTFKDLEFKIHPHGIGQRAVLAFDNGYSASVCFGSMFYSNEINTYGLAVMTEEGCCYSTGITDDVLGRLTQDEVTEALIKIQKLPMVTEAELKAQRKQWEETMNLVSRL